MERRDLLLGAPALLATQAFAQIATGDAGSLASAVNVLKEKDSLLACRAALLLGHVPKETAFFLTAPSRLWATAAQKPEIYLDLYFPAGKDAAFKNIRAGLKEAGSSIRRRK